MDTNSNELFKNRPCNECNNSDDVEIITIGENGIALCMECRNKLRKILGIEKKPIGIELKNIDLSGISVLEQLMKVKEEEMEFMVAIESADKENAIEELFDTIQSKLGLLDKIFGITTQEVMDQYPKHLEKIKLRPREKGKE